MYNKQVLLTKQRLWGLLYVCESWLQSAKFQIWLVFHLMFSEVISEIWWYLVQMLNSSSVHSLPVTKTKCSYSCRPNLHLFLRLFRSCTNPKQIVKIKLRQTPCGGGISIANVAEWIALLFHSQKISHPNVGLETPNPSWRLQSPGIIRSIDSYVGTDVLEELAASIFRTVKEK